MLDCRGSRTGTFGTALYNLNLVLTDPKKGYSTWAKQLTGNGLSVTSTLASCDEDNITLACIGVLVLKKEEFIDTIVI